jgi:hypothetical protein
MALLMMVSCESEHPPPQLAVRTLTRVASPGGSFEAVFTRIDPGVETPLGYIYQLHVVPVGGAGGDKPAVELRHLDLQTPIELEWQGENKLVLSYGAADVSAHEQFAKVIDWSGNEKQVEVVIKSSAEKSR